MSGMQPDILTFGRFLTPIGPALTVTDETGTLRAFNWTDREDRVRHWLGRHHNAVRLVEGESPVAEVFARYFAGEPGAFEGVAWTTAGTAFQREVWTALTTIPVGQTWSYRELAAAIGRPSAVRAVGLANGANPLSVIVPCHRVIGANGALTGYGGGLPRKAWLLAHERDCPSRLAA
ncbi:MAG: ogt [Caulobacteraceae bacterium]|nr:ogt [Caulobacteraceae bacterium]